jgi:type IV pilus assembly protein PilB
MGFREEELKDIRVMKGKGCAQCAGTGYNGRLAMFEVMPIDKSMKTAILECASSVEIKKIAMDSGMITLRDHGMIKVKEGLTTLEEVVRVTFSN